jgi:hypothetical protein
MMVSKFIYKEAYKLNPEVRGEKKPHFIRDHNAFSRSAGGRL